MNNILSTLAVDRLYKIFKDTSSMQEFCCKTFIVLNSLDYDDQENTGKLLIKELMFCSLNLSSEIEKIRKNRKEKAEADSKKVDADNMF